MTWNVRQIAGSCGESRSAAPADAFLAADAGSFLAFGGQDVVVAGDDLLDPLVAAINPGLVAANGVGTDVAGQLLVTAGHNHDRLASEAAFAMLCGAAPIPASSGKTHRHRLNRSGDRQANKALYRVVICRLRWDPHTRAYMERRTKDGLSKKEIIRCLKRYVARELYKLITTPNDHELAA